MSPASSKSQTPSVTKRGTRVAAILLAAGGASRMGEPKALLDWHGEPLVRHLTRVANASRCAATWVVSGEHSDAIRRALAGLACQVVEHPGWAEGLGSSIAAAVRALPQECEAVILLLCDQPFVTEVQLDALIDLYIEGRSPAGCRYGDAVGPPALFARSHFAQLAALRGDSGAKPLLVAAGEAAAFIDFPEGAIDLDTPDDYARALARRANRGHPPA